MAISNKMCVSYVRNNFFECHLPLILILKTHRKFNFCMSCYLSSVCSKSYVIKIGYY